MDRMRYLVDTLNKWAYEYYVQDAPSVSDREYDALYDELKELERETGVRLPDSPTRRVGGEPIKAFARHAHIAPHAVDLHQNIRALANQARAAHGRGDLAVFYQIPLLHGEVEFARGGIDGPAAHPGGVQPMEEMISFSSSLPAAM